MTRDQLSEDLKTDLQYRSYKLIGDPKQIIDEVIRGRANGKALFLKFLNNVAKKLIRYEAVLNSIYVLEEDKKRRVKLCFKNGEKIFDELLRLKYKVFLIEVKIRNKKFQIPIKL